jgi:uncharacterized delta-60 repeat protein
MHAKTTSHLAWLSVFSILLVSSTLAAAQAGQLDPTFGQGGIVTADFGDQINSNRAVASAVTIQPDGKILVCGGVPTSSGFPTAAIARYNPDGSLDTSFGTSGFAITSNLGVLAAITIQTDGKIVVAGPIGAIEINVARYLANGYLDATFGTGGIFTSGFIFNAGATQSAVAVQPDGKILVADGVLLRLLANGQLDTSFGASGVATVVGSQAIALALLPTNGKILVASNSGFASRYNPNGSLDTNFGIHGQVLVPSPANGLLLLGTGKFRVAGSLTSSLTGPVTGFAVAGYQGFGVTDTTFATHGGVVTPVPSFPTVATSGLGVQSSGDIVTLGIASTATQPQVFALARYTPAGQLDTTFGTNGTVTTSFGTTTLTAPGLAIQSDGKIVAVAGFTTTVPHGEFDTGFKLARYLGQ